MKINIIEGKHTDENIQKSYQYIVNLFRKEQIGKESQPKT